MIKIFTLVGISLVSLMLVNNVNAYTNENCFTLSGSEIINYNNNCPKDVDIPPVIKGVKITKIGDNSFQDKYLKSVVIPNTVTNIGHFSFEGNKITKVIIGDNVKTIGVGSFEHNQIKNLVIPDSVTEIMNNSFQNNQITNLIIGKGLKSIGVNAFTNNKITNLIIPKNVTKIDKSAFNDNQLPDEQAFIYARNLDGSEDKTTIISYGGKKRDNVIIPNGVKNINDYAFYRIQLKSITIPDTVENIGEYAFSSNQLTKITFLGNNNISIGKSSFYYQNDKNTTGLSNINQNVCGVWKLVNNNWEKDLNSSSFCNKNFNFQSNINTLYFLSGVILTDKFTYYNNINEIPNNKKNYLFNEIGINEKQFNNILKNSTKGINLINNKVLILNFKIIKNSTINEIKNKIIKIFNNKIKDNLQIGDFVIIIKK